MGEKAGKDLSKTPIIIAELGNEQSLIDMASKAKVIVNCAGPYRFYGEQVVKACISQGTHHVDVSGEPQYMEKMQLDYNEAAQEKGVFVVSACGFDSIPADMGVLFLEEKFGDGSLNSIETYLRLRAAKQPPVFTTVLHSATWRSAIYVYSKSKELQAIRNKLFKKEFPSTPVLKKRSIIHRSKYVDGKFCIENWGADDTVVLRSQRYFFENETKKPIQIKSYISIEYFSISYFLGIIWIAGFFLFLTIFSFGRKLLIKYPKFFTWGAFSEKGPSENFLETTNFEMIFKGKGFVEGKSKKIIAKLSGKNPAYKITSISVLSAAITILEDSKKMPIKFGVLTPAAAFAKTKLIERLCENGLKFEIDE